MLLTVEHQAGRRSQRNDDRTDRRLASRTRLRIARNHRRRHVVDRDQLEVQKRCETLRVLGAGAVAEIPDHGQAGGGDPVAIERLLQKVPIRFNLGRVDPARSRNQPRGRIVEPTGMVEVEQLPLPQRIEIRTVRRQRNQCIPAGRLMPPGNQNPAVIAEPGNQIVHHSGGQNSAVDHRTPPAGERCGDRALKQFGRTARIDADQDPRPLPRHRRKSGREIPGRRGSEAGPDHPPHSGSADAELPCLVVLHFLNPDSRIALRPPDFFTE